MPAETLQRPGLSSRVLAAANVLAHHPAYLFSRIWPIYGRYESARLKVLHQRGVKPVSCMGMFFILPDPLDSNTGVSSSVLLRGGLYEPESTYFFRQLIHEGNTIVDIGANIGWYTLLAATTLGPHGRVVACEPEPHNFRLLEASVRMNKLKNVTLVEKCVSDSNGEVSLHLATTNAGGHTIIGTSTPTAEEIRVGSITLDDLTNQLSLDQVDFVKIDAESAEPLVLMGAAGLLSRGQPEHILMEFTPRAWEGYEWLLLRLFNEFEIFEIYRSLLVPLSISKLPKDRQGMLLLARKKNKSSG